MSFVGVHLGEQTYWQCQTLNNTAEGANWRTISLSRRRLQSNYANIYRHVQECSRARSAYVAAPSRLVTGTCLIREYGNVASITV